MKTSNKLRMMMMAVVAIVCGMTLVCCGGDDDNDGPGAKKQVDRVDMHVTCSMSEDLAHLISVRLDGEQDMPYSSKSNSMYITTDGTQQTLLTVNKFPAKMKTTVSINDIRNAPKKDKYDIECNFKVILVTYFTDGSNEVTPIDKPLVDYQSSISGVNEADLDRVLTTYKNLITTYLTKNVSLAQKEESTGNHIYATVE